ncbi:MAG: hypothetical protein ACOVOI_01595, partial [Hyphomicrobiales bacterium]
AMVMQDPTFQAGTGRFNRDFFNAVIRQNGLTEAAFFDQQRKVYQRAQLAEAIGGDVAVSRILREALARYGTETRSIEYFVIGESALPSMPEPDAAKLAAFFEERKAQFGAPEHRRAADAAARCAGTGDGGRHDAGDRCRCPQRVRRAARHLHHGRAS